MDSLFLDLRHALRSLARRPGFAAVVIATMALGIGANVAAFAYLAYFQWPTIEAPGVGRLVWLYDRAPDEPLRGLSYPDLVDLGGLPEAAAEIAAFRLFGTSIVSGEVKVHAWGSAVSGDYFALFAARPQLGRLLGPEDDRPGAPRAAVVNDLFWRRHLGADPGVLGKTLELDGGLTATLVGVTRPGFQGPGLATGIYVPLATAEPLLSGLSDRDNGSLSVLLRPQAGVGPEALAAALSSRGAALDAERPRETPRDLVGRRVVESNELWSGDPLARGARVLAVTVGLLLLLASANVGSLLLARAAARRREVAVHAALGASRLRLGARLLVESLLLATAGGALGLLLASRLLAVIEDYLLRTVPIGMGDWGLGSTLTLDPLRVGGFVVAVTAGTALVFGSAPLWQTWRLDLVSALKVEGGAGGGKLGLRRLLVVAQIALATVLLVGATLLVRTLLAASARPLGFAVDGRTLATVHAPRGFAGDEEAGVALYDEILARARELPGIRSASLAWRVPASFASPEPIELADGSRRTVTSNVVGPGYFETLAIPMLQGRGFDDGDRRDAPAVVVVNGRAVAELFGGRSPLGQVVKARDPRRDDGGLEATVVGVVADSVYAAPSEPIGPHLYFSYRQRFRPRMTLVVEASGFVQRQLDELVRDQPRLTLIDVQPLAEQLRRAVINQRMNADFTSAVGLLGLLLATLGVFSVTSYVTSRRSREIALRMALGADPGRVRRWVAGGATRDALVGIGLGALAAWGLGRLLESVLFGVEARDPVTFAGVAAILLVATLAAAALPALRAARLDPARTLRQE